MGHKMSVEFKNDVNYILDYECNKLDLSERRGSTDYIDFINVEELGDNDIMKGIDICSRKFFIFKASVIFSDGSVTRTCTTFFQRYTGDENVWQTGSTNITSLLYTEGGTSDQQINFVKRLIYGKEIVLNVNEINNLRLCCYPTESVKVILGHEL